VHSPCSVVYRFGTFQLNLATGELRKNGIKQKIQDQPLDVLVKLLEHKGEIVTREELQHTLWPADTFVSFETGLNTAIKRLREVLGDSIETPTFIGTIPKRGYRFLAAVNTVEVASPVPNNDNANEKRPRTTRNRLVLLGGIITLIFSVIGFAWYKLRRGPSDLPAQLTERQLTANPPEDPVEAAAISPDGKHLAYLDQTGLFVRSVDSGETRPIALPADFPSSQIQQIRWFPEGDKLIITRTSSISEGTSIWTAAVLGEAAPKRLHRQASSPAISPDGRSMVFLSGAPYEPKEMWVSGLDGEQPRKLAAAEEGQRFEGPVWSPDSQWIAYWRLKSKGADFAGTSIEIRPATGGPYKTVVSESNLPPSSLLDCEEACLAWSPDWNLIFTASKASNISSEEWKNSLWKVKVDPHAGSLSQKPGQATQWADYFLGNITITSDGKVLSLNRGRLHSDVYVGALGRRSGALQTPHRLTLDIHDSFPEGWMEDNQSLIFVSNRNGKDELFKQKVNDSTPERIVSSRAGEIGSGNGLSPGGSWILYWQIARAEGTVSPVSKRLMRQPSAGGPPETVLELPYSEARAINFFCPVKPSTSCVMNEWEGNSLRFYVLDPMRGKGPLLGKIEVDKHWYFGWALSQDGSLLAVVDQTQTDRIKILSLAKGAWHEIAVEPGWGEYRSITWTADGEGFFLTTVSPGAFNLVRVTMSGKVQLLMKNAHGPWMSRPRPSLDGKYLAFMAQTLDSNVWLLENF
jgi:DNA-binding winged helix-turn-helix (wHTH) protein/Tol biopolymer transport system component